MYIVRAYKKLQEVAVFSVILKVVWTERKHKVHNLFNDFSNSKGPEVTQRDCILGFKWKDLTIQTKNFGGHKTEDIWSLYNHGVYVGLT